ncbi:hypothetical protein Cgig2_025489 [Carnegiea gigantea]|uniref:Uncharacterized protein n=1 Tax=Carnegiea gigantea TaxID=171969 RepID=A0A9Q1K7Y0_9CARY|nr:hypothetical protein Cgig2_025489 [Carnegiea gigantea]
MVGFCFVSKKLEYLCSWLCVGMLCLVTCLCWAFSVGYEFITYRISHFWIEVCYFTRFIYGIRHLNTKTIRPNERYKFVLHLGITTTVTSMSTVEMEVLSNAQLIVLTILMFFEGRLRNTPFKARSWVHSMASPKLPSEDELEYLFEKHRGDRVPYLLPSLAPKQALKVLSWNSLGV